MRATISPKYQVVIPRELRESLQLKPGGEVEFLQYGNRIEMIPVWDIRKMRGYLRGDRNAGRSGQGQGVNLVDSCGWLEYLADGPNADFFAGPLEKAARLLVPTICIAEVFKRLLQQKGEDAALHVAALMQQGNVVDLDSALAIEAARLGHACAAAG